MGLPKITVAHSGDVKEGLWEGDTLGAGHQFPRETQPGGLAKDADENQ